MITQLSQVPRVKKWMDRQGNVTNVEINAQEEVVKLPEVGRRPRPSRCSIASQGVTKEGNAKAEAAADAFRKYVLLEEKLYLSWLNERIAGLNKSVTDIGPAIKDGVLVIEALKCITKKPGPSYAKKPNVMQELDNWHVIITWMRCGRVACGSRDLMPHSKLGIPVDPIPADQCKEQDEGQGVALDKTSLLCPCCSPHPLTATQSCTRWTAARSSSCLPRHAPRRPQPLLTPITAHAVRVDAPRRVVDSRAFIVCIDHRNERRDFKIDLSHFRRACHERLRNQALVRGSSTETPRTHLRVAPGACSSSRARSTTHESRS